jgi:hypothetical protein
VRVQSFAHPVRTLDNPPPLFASGAVGVRGAGRRRSGESRGGVGSA